MSNKIDPIVFESHNLLREVKPLDVSTDPNGLVTGGTCTGRLFDDKKDSALATAVPSGVAVPVKDARPFVIGDTIYVKLDDGTWHDGGVLVSKSGNVLTVTVPINPVIGAGLYRRVSVKLGADISMPEYGAPTLTTKTWGYGGTIQPTHADLRIGLSVRVETEIVSGGSLTLVSNYKTSVVGGT